MGKLILARESDKGISTGQKIAIFSTMGFVCGFGGIPVGAILSAVMQAALKDSSISIKYGFFLTPVFVGMIIGFFFAKKELDTKNHTRCETCRKIMQPMTEMDAIFRLPLYGDSTYDNAMEYLASHMERIPGVHDITPGGRGCFVCVYCCKNCGKRIVRIMDFLPELGNCAEQNTYYFDYDAFCRIRQNNDLI